MSDFPEMLREHRGRLYAFTEQHPNCRLNVETMPLNFQIRCDENKQK